MSNDHLRVFGWILGLATRIARAEIRYGEVVVDLIALGIAVPRPDVTEHFRSQVTVPDDAHGFYLSAALPPLPARTSYLRLWTQDHAGETAETVWPVSMGGPVVADFFAEHGPTLAWLIQQVDPAEAALIRSWNLPPPVAAVGKRPVPLGLRLGIDVCCYLAPGRFVVLGRLDDAGRIQAASLTLGSRKIDLEGLLDVSSARPAPAGKNLRDQAVTERPFMVTVRVPPDAQEAADAIIEVIGENGTGRVRRSLALNASGGRAEFAEYLRTLEPDRALGVLERLAESIRESADAGESSGLEALVEIAVRSLPISLERADLGFLFHCDTALAIGASGVFMTGWLVVEDGIRAEVHYHRGFESRRLDESWMRHARSDVTAHLSARGAAVREDDHGFACFAEVSATAAPAYLSITAGGIVHRMRCPDVTPASPLQAVRSVLASFHVTHRALRTILDTQVGPAVESAWAQRPRVAPAVSVQRFGAAPTAPPVSVIVPLYGRYDFADYQLALFADDPDFQTAELIYFVDDPGIFDAFRAQCHDLYQTYRVPFTLAFAGRNLGYSGANNAAASIARAPHLLLMNSDVLPKSPGWLGELLTLYAALKKPGLLGVKLLYEDGSVQHAGMVFRRHAPWGDLWINDHPYKGQSALGLTGLRKVDAVTAACALVSADLYRDLGGLSEDYIIGDFEDSDFCLRAAAAGRKNWVSLDVELYHLERQSQARIGDDQWRTHLTLYNCWQHDRRWRAQLEKLKR
jgi:GT2 family glycosyltransferase